MNEQTDAGASPVQREVRAQLWLTAQEVLSAAELAGLLPNTVHSWLPPLIRYTQAILRAAASKAEPFGYAMLDKHGELVYCGITYERSPDLVLDCDLRHPDNAPHSQVALIAAL